MTTMTKATSKRKRDAATGHLLEAATVRDVLRLEPFRHVVTLDHTWTVSKALQVLAREHIISAPVVLAGSLEDNEMGTYLGMFDFGVVLQHMLRVLADADTTATTTATTATADDDAGDGALRAAGEHVLNMTLISVAGDDAGLVYRASLDTSLSELLHDVFLHADGTHVHRVAIFDGYGSPSAIVSQSDVVRYVCREMHRLTDVRSQTVAQLDLGSVDVVCVDERSSAITALKKMKGWSVRSLCITGEAGMAVDTLSLSDLRGIIADDFTRLSLPVGRFKREVSPTPSVSSQCPLVTTTEHATFADVVELFMRTGLHTVYTLDALKKPHRIITLSDIIRVVDAHRYQQQEQQQKKQQQPQREESPPTDDNNGGADDTQEKNVV